MGLLSGALTGFAVGGPLGAGIGGFIGLGTSLLAGSTQWDQDKRALQRDQESLTLQLGEAKGLASIETGAIESKYRLSSKTNIAQATRYAANQELLAGQTEESAARQMTVMGMQAQSQNTQANQQFINMQLAGSQAIGQSQQRAGLSGLRNTGSVRSAQIMQENLYTRQITSAEKQLEQGRAIVSSQLQHADITASQAASQLRAQGAERQTAVEETNALLRLNADIAKTKVETTLKATLDRINMESGWNEEDLDWLNGQGLLTTLATSLL